MKLRVLRVRADALFAKSLLARCSKHPFFISFSDIDSEIRGDAEKIIYCFSHQIVKISSELLSSSSTLLELLLRSVFRTTRSLLYVPSKSDIDKISSKRSTFKFTKHSLLIPDRADDVQDWKPNDWPEAGVNLTDFSRVIPPLVRNSRDNFLRAKSDISFCRD